MSAFLSWTHVVVPLPLTLLEDPDMGRLPDIPRVPFGAPVQRLFLLVGGLAVLVALGLAVRPGRPLLRLAGIVVGGGGGAVSLAFVALLLRPMILLGFTLSDGAFLLAVTSAAAILLSAGFGGVELALARRQRAAGGTAQAEPNPPSAAS